MQCETEKITFKSQNEIQVDILKEENKILQKSKGELLLKIFELENDQKDMKFEEKNIQKDQDILKIKIKDQE